MEASLPPGSKSPTYCMSPWLRPPTSPFCHLKAALSLPICLAFRSGPEKTGCWPAYLSSPQALKSEQDSIGRPGLETWRGQYLTL